jgi:hypothetical protein
MARNKTPGDAMRRGAVKPRSQVKNPLTGTWTKGDDVKADKPFLQSRKKNNRDAGVTRIEVIEEAGEHTINRRAYVRHGVSIELSYQDDGRTLKVFVREGKA